MGMGMGFISKCQRQERDQTVPIVSQHIQAHCTNAQLKAVSFQRKKSHCVAIQKNAKKYSINKIITSGEQERASFPLIFKRLVQLVCYLTEHIIIIKQ